jgi:DNA replication initiation complex subunit (GINS family)
MSSLNINMDHDEDDDFLNAEVDDIISQIKNQSKIVNQLPKEQPNLKKEDLEEFVITNAGKVVNHSLEMVENLKLEVLTGADSKLIESVSELVKATTSAIDALSKLKISEDKIKAQKEITQMNIQAKIIRDEEENSTPKLTFTRNDIIKLLNQKEESPVVDV